MIELKNISKIYKSKMKEQIKALDNISISFDRNQMCFILGKSGSGKTTLLNIIGGLDTYDSGSIKIFGRDTKNFESKDYDAYRNTYIGFVFQEFNLLDDYNVYENILIAAQLQGKQVLSNEIDKILKELEIYNLKKRKINELSGGQKQRVAIARALIKNPKIIIADEPTGNLDSKTSETVMGILKNISKEKLVIIVTHDKEQAEKYGDRIIKIEDGIVISDKIISNIEEKSNHSIYETIKSKLPFKESIKLGLGCLKHKKIRLSISIILSIISLTVFGFVNSITSYNIDNEHYKLLQSKKINQIQLEKSEISNSEFYSNKKNMILSEDDILNVKNKLNNVNHEVIYKVRNNYSYKTIFEALNIPYDYDLYLELIAIDSLINNIDVKIKGEYPKENNQILISNVIADYIIENGIKVKNRNEIYYPQNYEELIDKNNSYIFDNNKEIKFSGIILYDIDEYNMIREKYEHNPGEITKLEYKKLNEFFSKEQNIYNKVYVSTSFINSIKEKNETMLNNEYSYTIDAENIIKNSTSSKILNDEIEYYDGKTWKTRSKLNENEIILNLNQLKTYDQNKYINEVKNEMNKNITYSQKDVEKKIFEKYVIESNIIEKFIDIQIKIQNSNKLLEKKENIKIIGVTGLISESDTYHYYSDELLNDYEISRFPQTGILVIEKDKDILKKIINMFPYESDISVKSIYSNSVDETVRTIKLYKNIAIPILIISTLFTVLLISNFISTSILYKRKEIGILRSLGASNKDIIKIFIWEGIIIATSTLIISFILLFIIINIMNRDFLNNSTQFLSPFVINGSQSITMFILIYIIVLISSIVPLKKIANQTPIDAIAII